jgi:DNA-binding YbaB/EbfC family protein
MFDSIKALSQIGPMMAKAKEMQSRMVEFQKTLPFIEASGAAGGEAVRVTANGRLEIMSFEFGPDAPTSDPAKLSDLCREATNAALRAVQAQVQTKMQESMGDVDMEAMRSMLGQG